MNFDFVQGINVLLRLAALCTLVQFWLNSSPFPKQAAFSGSLCVAKQCLRKCIEYQCMREIPYEGLRLLFTRPNFSSKLCAKICH